MTRSVQSALFTLNDSREGIWVRIGEETIPAGTLFGPLRGVLKEIVVKPVDSSSDCGGQQRRSTTTPDNNADLPAATADAAADIRQCLENRHFWNLGTSPDGVASFLDVTDEQKSNWMRFVKKWVQSDSGEESNLTAILHERKIYFVASQPLRPGEELCFWYAKDYLSLLDIQDFSNKVESLNVSSAGDKERKIPGGDKEKSGAGGGEGGGSSRNFRSSGEGKECQGETSSDSGLQLFACYVCKKSDFDSRAVLLRHIEASHPEEAVGDGDSDGGLTCDVCCKSFSAVAALNKHKRYHMIKKKYKCHACSNVAFKQKSHLANHLIMHTKEKRFMCKLCSALFGRISDLRNHVKTVHDVDKTFACSHCAKKFKTVKILNKHVSKHLFRFCCARCRKSFASNYHLKRHEMFSSCLNRAIGRVIGDGLESGK